MWDLCLAYNGGQGGTLKVSDPNLQELLDYGTNGLPKLKMLTVMRERQVVRLKGKDRNVHLAYACRSDHHNGFLLRVPDRDFQNLAEEKERYRKSGPFRYAAYKAARAWRAGQKAPGERVASWAREMADTAAEDPKAGTFYVGAILAGIGTEVSPFAPFVKAYRGQAEKVALRTLQVADVRAKMEPGIPYLARGTPSYVRYPGRIDPKTRGVWIIGEMKYHRFWSGDRLFVVCESPDHVGTPFDPTAATLWRRAGANLPEGDDHPPYVPKLPSGGSSRGSPPRVQPKSK